MEKYKIIYVNSLQPCCKRLNFLNMFKTLTVMISDPKGRNKSQLS